MQYSCRNTARFTSFNLDSKTMKSASARNRKDSQGSLPRGRNPCENRKMAVLALSELGGFPAPAKYCATSQRIPTPTLKNEPVPPGSFSGPAPDFFGDFAKFPTNSQPATKNEPGGTGSFFRVGVGIRCEVAQYCAGARNPVNSDSASTAIFDFSNVCTHPGPNVTNRYDSLLAHFS